jgi:hypothetical protein
MNDYDFPYVARHERVETKRISRRPTHGMRNRGLDPESTDNVHWRSASTLELLIHIEV